MSDPFIHESAYVDNGARIGAGTKVWHFCHVLGGAVIGERCVLGQNVVAILLGSLLVGLIVSLLQSVTSIQEQTLSFVPKLLAVSLVIVLGAPWILRQLMQFTITYISRLPDMVR